MTARAVRDRMSAHRPAADRLARCSRPGASPSWGRRATRPSWARSWRGRCRASPAGVRHQSPDSEPAGQPLRRAPTRQPRPARPSTSRCSACPLPPPPRALADAAGAASGAALICSGGFAEAGGPGVPLPARLASTAARDTGIALLGPNTSGFFAAGRELTATSCPGAPRRRRPGRGGRRQRRD